MTRNVKGHLFADYVRMIRSHKEVDWARHLTAEDLRSVAARIAPDHWYPMATFERLGNAILRQIAHDDLESVRMWGRGSVDMLRVSFPALVAVGDRVDTLRRFQVLRGTFFDFTAIEIPMLIEGQAHVIIHYYMGDVAEEAASYQTMGFFERLVEVAGATAVEARFLQRSWARDPRTLLELHWRPS
ncbi:MAG TPA: hypothetical protein VKI41_00120 [Vicinamibacteria bacterium]|nr:hypothetical protein [Vicinamibacteria bacterium]